MTDQPPTRPLSVHGGSPIWHVDVRRDHIRGGVHVLAGRAYPDGVVDILGGELTVTRHEDPHLVPEDRGGLMLPEPLARALYDALAAHYGHAEPTRSLRADFEHERRRHGETVDTLALVTKDVIELAKEVAQRSPVVVFGREAPPTFPASERLTDFEPNRR